MAKKAASIWAQQEPNTLLIKWLDQPTQVLRAGTPWLSPIAQFNTRTPAGHPEGYLEAFANLYRCFAITLSARIEGTTPPKEALDFPGVEDGVRGMAFIDTLLRSNASAAKWTDFEIPSSK